MSDCNPFTIFDRVDRKKIGVVGKMRRGNQFDKTIDVLLKLQEKFDFLLTIGTDDLSSFSNIDSDRDLQARIDLN
jgi:hypothetical protein